MTIGWVEMLGAPAGANSEAHIGTNRVTNLNQLEAKNPEKPHL